MTIIRITFWNLGAMVKDIGESIRSVRLANYGKAIMEKV